MDVPKASHHKKESGKRSEQGFRIEGLKQSIIAVYGDALDKIGFSITEKANRSAQSRLGKTLHTLETMESKEESHYRRQKQELMDSLDRLQGEQLKIRKKNHKQGKRKQSPVFKHQKCNIIRDDIGLHYRNTLNQPEDVSDGQCRYKHKEDSYEIVKDPENTTVAGDLPHLTQRSSSAMVVSKKPFKDIHYITRPLTPEIPCNLPKLNTMQASLISKSSHDIPHLKSDPIKPKQKPTQQMPMGEAGLSPHGKLLPDSTTNRENRSASFSQYGSRQIPKPLREKKCVSPVGTKPIEHTNCIHSDYPPNSLIKMKSQSNSPLLPRRQACKGKDWIPPEKEELLAELEEYRVELQQRVNHFLAKTNPQ